MRCFRVFFVLLTLCSCSVKDIDYTQFVNTKIGSGGHGHCFVGANVPFGMVQLGPTSIPKDEWDWCSGYHDSDSTVIGFSHTHLSGTGIGDLCDVTLMPVVGEVEYSRNGLFSYADRSKEISTPGYYSVPLIRYNIKAELTASSRIGFHRYTFPKASDAAIVIDLENGSGWDKATATEIIPINNTTICGKRYSTGWANDQKVYFYAKFSKSFDFQKINDLYARLSFSTEKDEQVLIKLALSSQSIEGAKANFDAEIKDWDFDAVALEAKKSWNKELSKIKIDTKQSKRIFYTALYHTMIAPSDFNDYGQTPHYTTYSLWDTYRAAMPLMTIIHPQRMPEIINDMLSIYDKQGRLPVWYLWGCETDCMVGNPGAVVVADAITKEIQGFDTEKAFKALVQTQNQDIRGLNYRKQYSFIPSDLFPESIAYDMEYAIADAAIANAAKALGKDPEKFIERSHSYRNYFDTQTGFIRGRFKDGSWRNPFNPFSAEHRANDYCEGNAWQYTWLVPHDLEGLQHCFGSKEILINKLDSLFTLNSELLGHDASPDISGLIGQYAQGNEPSHHIVYFYTMLGQPWKTADKIRHILNTMYTDQVDGLCGNEDVGQMSAWYIFSSLGFYPVEPGAAKYCFGVPFFEKTEIQVQGGSFTIIAEGLSDTNKYIQKVWLNNKLYNKSYINHCDIVKGGELRFEMGPKAKIWY